ncbi:MAG: integrase arm-type DNA-binding domain-containing protein [Desulfuromonadales bacterium]|nr:integrase arm-type DNA-binding domain-containing protein [Desulfuromonadales bacterium]
MPKIVVPLTDAQVKNAKAGSSDFKLFDGKGLFLLVTQTGGKLWRFRYQFDGKDKTIALGKYPEIPLAEARKRRDQARQLIAGGWDPADVKRQAKIENAEKRANTFEKLARDWHDRQAGTLSDRTRKMIMARLLRDVFPVIGGMPLAELKPRAILENVLRPIEDRGAVELSHRMRGVISQVLRYGVACGACERDLTIDLRGAFKPVQRRHHAALDASGTTDPTQVGALLRAIDDFEGSIIVKCALKLHPLVATRPGELRHAEWMEIDFDSATWSIPAGKMKMKNPHIVPLSESAIFILRELQRLTGGGKYLFPSVRSTSRPISDNTMNAALRRLGYGSDEMVSHGWRAIFRTLADEVLQERIDIIEAQLAHQVQDTLGRAYNRTSFLKERRELMTRWAQYLDGLRNDRGKVIPLRRTAP